MWRIVTPHPSSICMVLYLRWTMMFCIAVAQKIVATRKKQQLSIGPCKSLPNSPSHSSICAPQVSNVQVNQVSLATRLTVSTNYCCCFLFSKFNWSLHKNNIDDINMNTLVSYFGCVTVIIHGVMSLMCSSNFAVHCNTKVTIFQPIIGHQCLIPPLTRDTYFTATIR